MSLLMKATTSINKNVFSSVLDHRDTYDGVFAPRLLYSLPGNRFCETAGFEWICMVTI